MLKSAKMFLLVLIFGIVFVLISKAKAEDTLFVSSTTYIYLDDTHTKAVGTLEIGAKVHLLKKRDKWCEVNIKGWQQKGLTSVIYAFMGKRIVKAEITPSGERFIKTLKTVKDPDTQLVWSEIELDKVWVSCKPLTVNMDTVWKPVSKLFHQRCSMCHALPRSTTFTANQWPATLRVMTKRAALDKDQADEVSKFLQYHARDIKGIHQP